MKKHHKFAKIGQFTPFCRDFDLVAKYAFSQAPSCTNFSLPGSALDSRTGQLSTKDDDDDCNDIYDSNNGNFDDNNDKNYPKNIQISAKCTNFRDFT